MPDQYQYQAVSDKGVISEGVVTANDTDYVLEFLSEQNLRPIGVKRIDTKRPLSLFGFLKGSFYENLIMFTNSLSTLHRSGVPLLRSLVVLRAGSSNERFNEAIDQIRSAVQSGRSLSEAMGDFPDLFSKVYIASVAAGEESGRLDEILDELSTMLETEMELTRQVKAAVRYPAIVVGIILAAFVVVMTYVVPRFIEFFSSFGVELPLPTRILIATSDFFTSYWIPILAVTIVGTIVFRKYINTRDGRLWYDCQMLRVPAIGEIAVKGNVARFALMFRILFKAGIPLVKTLDILSDVVKNAVISQEISKLGEIFQKGKENVDITKDFRFFPKLALNMMSIGMESGSLEKMSEEIGKHYTKDVMYRSRQLTAVLEPILTLIIGVFILVLALAIFLPMWSLIKVFQAG